MHARKAWLAGLSPKQNREVPPLDHARVHRLKAAYPDFTIVLNGGIGSVEAAAEHLAHVDGVMMGRAAYQEPWRLLDVDPLLFGAPAPFASPKAAAEALIPYIERATARGVRFYAIVRHVLGLFHAVPGARAFRRHLATEGVKPDADARVLRQALALVLDTAYEPAHVAPARVLASRALVDRRPTSGSASTAAEKQTFQYRRDAPSATSRRTVPSVASSPLPRLP